MSPELIFVEGIPAFPLPSESDFDPYGGGLDAQSAWAHFGNLPLAEACSKFCELPEIYQEDFMFMGCKAFHYYYPVIEYYLYQARNNPATVITEAEILAHDIAAQFDWNGAVLSSTLIKRILELCGFVLSDPARFAAVHEERSRIQTAWSALEKRALKEASG